MDRVEIVIQEQERERAAIFDNDASTGDPLIRAMLKKGSNFQN